MSDVSRQIPRRSSAGRVLLSLALLLAPARMAFAETMDLEVSSQALERQIRVRVVTPSPGIATRNVLVFLHGYGSSYVSLSRLVPLQEFADRHGLVFICPDGDRDSWWMDSPRPGGRPYGTFLSSDLPAWIREQGIPDSLPIHISGMSMGGYGALRMAAAQKSPYRSVLAFAPVTDPALHQGQFGLRAIFGNNNALQSAALTNHAGTLPASTRVLVYVGAADWTLPEAQTLVREWTRKGIRITLVVRDGGHDGAFVSHWFSEALDSLLTNPIPPFQ